MDSNINKKDDINNQVPRSSLKSSTSNEDHDYHVGEEFEDDPESLWEPLEPGDEEQTLYSESLNIDNVPDRPIEEKDIKGSRRIRPDSSTWKELGIGKQENIFQRFASFVSQKFTDLKQLLLKPKIKNDTIGETMRKDPIRSVNSANSKENGKQYSDPLYEEMASDILKPFSASVSVDSKSQTNSGISTEKPSKQGSVIGR